MRLRSCGLIFAMLTGVQDALGGSLPSGCGVICGDSDVWDCASSHNDMMGRHLPAPTRTSFVLHSNHRSQLSPFSCGKNQSKSSAREG